MSAPDRRDGLGSPRASGSRSRGAPRRARGRRSPAARSCCACRASGTTRRRSGLLGLAVLQGELPIYFFGQSFMGALDALPGGARLLSCSGVSARTLELVPVLLALARVGLTVRLAHGRLRAAGRACSRRCCWRSRPTISCSGPTRPATTTRSRSSSGRLALLFALRVPARRSGPGHAAAASSWGRRSGWPSGPTSSRSSTYPAVAVLLLRPGLRLRRARGSWPRMPAFAARQPAALALRRAPRHGSAPAGSTGGGVGPCSTHLYATSPRRRGPSSPVCAEFLRGAACRASALALALGARLPGAPRSRPCAGSAAPGRAGAARAGLALVVLACTNVGVAVVTPVRARPQRQRPPLPPAPLHGAARRCSGWFLATLPDRRHAVVLTAALLVAPRDRRRSPAASGTVQPAIAAGEGRELAMQRLRRSRRSSAPGCVACYELEHRDSRAHVSWRRSR